eukprot:m.85711 g.85711  ORF g.85711 m.85711 type:complete len:341 (+) comp19790_c0_seq1:4356-5378(+)
MRNIRACKFGALRLLGSELVDDCFLDLRVLGGVLEVTSWNSHPETVHKRYTVQSRQSCLCWRPSMGIDRRFRIGEWMQSGRATSPSIQNRNGRMRNPVLTTKPLTGHHQYLCCTQACFKQFGIIEKVVLIRERQSQRLRGFGFITFTKDTSATALVAQRFVECNNQMTECRWAKGKAAFTRQDSAASEEDPFHYRRGPEHLSHGIEYHTSEPSGEWSTMEDTYSDDAGYATDAPFSFVHPGTHPSYQHGFRRIESPPMGHFVPSFGHPMADHGSPMLSRGAECHTIGGYPAGIHNQSYQYPQSHFLDYRHAPAQPFQFVQMMPFRPCYHPMLGQGPQGGC